MSSSPISLLISLVALGVYGYSAYYMNYNPNLKKMNSLMKPTLRPYGQLKFLTYHCLLMQIVNAALHVGAYFVAALRKPRDIWFTAFAYPIGSIVVYSFWGVWFTFGRELIFPAALSQFYPDWLNHSTHTIIVPINIIMAVLVHHNYGRNRFLLTALYFAFYTSLLYFIKWESGWFVYAYLETMQEPIRAVYFLGTGVAAYIMFKSGQFLNNIFHSQQHQPIKKTKQK